jgi:hypothetical protein
MQGTKDFKKGKKRGGSQSHPRFGQGLGYWGWDDGMRQRASLPAIGAFIRTGSDYIGSGNGNFMEKEKEAYKSLEDELRKRMGDKGFTEIEGYIGRYSEAMEDLYYMSGMCASAELVLQLTGGRGYQ